MPVETSLTGTELISTGYIELVDGTGYTVALHIDSLHISVAENSQNAWIGTSAGSIDTPNTDSSPWTPSRADDSRTNANAGWYFDDVLIEEDVAIVIDHINNNRLREAMCGNENRSEPL